MEEWLEGEVVNNVKWTKNLASLKIKAKINNHQAGQFTRIGLKVNDDFCQYEELLDDSLKA